MKSPKTPTATRNMVIRPHDNYLHGEAKNLHHFIFAITLPYLSSFESLFIHIYPNKFEKNYIKINHFRRVSLYCLVKCIADIHVL